MIDDTAQNVNETTEDTSPVSLTVQDLVNLRNIIDVASQRGAFRANEFAVVGSTYNRLNDFINSVAPQPSEKDEETEESSGE